MSLKNNCMYFQGFKCEPEDQKSVERRNALNFMKIKHISYFIKPRFNFVDLIFYFLNLSCKWEESSLIWGTVRYSNVDSHIL